MAPSDETRAYVQFLVPRALEPRLPGFLEALEQSAPQLGVTDIQIALSQLEEVFLRVALQVRVSEFISFGGLRPLNQSHAAAAEAGLHARRAARAALSVVSSNPSLQAGLLGPLQTGAATGQTGGAG